MEKEVAIVESCDEKSTPTPTEKAPEKSPDVKRVEQIYRRAIRLCEKMIRELERRDFSETDTLHMLRFVRHTMSMLTTMTPYLENLRSGNPARNVQLVQIVNQIDAILRGKTDELAEEK